MHRLIHVIRSFTRSSLVCLIGLGVSKKIVLQMRNFIATFQGFIFKWLGWNFDAITREKKPVQRL